MIEKTESKEPATAGSECSEANEVDAPVRRVTKGEIVKTVVSDEEIEKAFAGTNFGDRKPRALLGMAVLKTLTGYHSGHTITTIMKELGLIDHRGKTTKKGKDFCLWEFYGDGRDSA